MPTANKIGSTPPGAPLKQGLYDPQFEHDSCGIGFVVNMKGKKSHQLVADGLLILMNLDHRGAVGCEANTGAGSWKPSFAVTLTRNSCGVWIKMPAPSPVLDSAPAAPR